MLGILKYIVGIFIMKKNKLCWSIFMTMIAMVMAACSGGVNQSDPRSVAEAALTGYTSGTLDGMETVKSLINPENTRRQAEIQKVIDGIKAMSANGGASKSGDHTFKFVKIYDKSEGGEVTEETTTAIAEFEDEEGYTRSVRLEKVDGKWYFDRFN